MNRRIFLKHLAALPVAAAIGGCKDNNNDRDKDKDKDKNHGDDQSNITSLKVLLFGPFGVVVRKDKNNRVKAYIPYDDMHEFRFGSPLKVVSQKEKRYDFELHDDGLIVSKTPPYIDRGFDDFNEELSTWTPPKDSFVSLDLPAPDAISYIPPTEGVLFSGGKYGNLPLNHILEYRVRQRSMVTMKSPQMPNLSGPGSCRELYEEYEKYKKQYAVTKMMTPLQRTLERWSESGAGYYFFGVGLELAKYGRLNGQRSYPAPQPTEKTHALDFFNSKLLPSLYGGQENVPKAKYLQAIDVSAPCDSQQGTGGEAALVSAVYRPDSFRPRLLRVLATENCTSPGATATASRTS